MKRIIWSMGIGVAMLAAGCGGGGGSPGATQLEYHITLRADKVELPLNIGNVQPGIGTYAPYTTTLYVSATEGWGGRPVPGAEEGNGFACRMDRGLEYGALYYLDGNPDHETEVDDGNGGKIKMPTAYSAVTLGINSGGSRFHFHAGNTAGVTRITCTITDPRDQQPKSASVDITVGSGGSPGGTQGMPASVIVQSVDPRTGPYVGRLGNLNNVPSSIALQAIIRDELNQQVTDPSAPNLQVSIVNFGDAADGARLIRGTQWGSVIQTHSRGGVADFNLASGSNRGVILLELVADRWDNNVANGIQFPVLQRVAVPVVDGIADEPLSAEAQTMTATCNRSTSYVLEAKGGQPPYQWRALSSMPPGLSLSSDGVVSGMPDFDNGANAGTYQVAVRVTDGMGQQADINLTIKVEAGDCKPLVVNTAAISAEDGVAFSYALSATGGTPPYKWKSLEASSGVSVSEYGIVSGTLAAGTYAAVVEVTDSKGLKATGTVNITVK